jgi:hypothetical protein
VRKSSETELMGWGCLVAPGHGLVEVFQGPDGAPFGERDECERFSRA